MTSRSQTFTVLPALFLLLMASYLAFLTFQVFDSSAKRGLLALGSCLFVGGLVLAICWVYYWGISKRLQENQGVVRSRKLSLQNTIGLFLIFFGSITLVWVGQLTWYDMATWGKDIALIFFGSRTGENLSLGMGMKVIHYFLIGLALLLSGIFVFLRRRLRKCPNHFGYLASRPEKAPIPKKCLICPKITDCISGQPPKLKQLAKSAVKKEKDSSKCPHHFGYLKSLPDNQAVPQECVTCERLLECKNPM